MKNKVILIASMLSVCIAFLIWWFSATQVLQRRSADLIDCVRVEEGTGRIPRSLNANKLPDLIDGQVTVTYPRMESLFIHAMSTNEPISLSSDHARAAILYLGSISDWIKVENESIDVLSITNDKAEVAVSFTMVTKLKKMAEKSAELKGSFFFTKTNDHWLLESANFD